MEKIEELNNSGLFIKGDVIPDYNDIVNIPDKKLRKSLFEAEADINNDGQLSKGELARIKSLKIIPISATEWTQYDDPIYSLEGLQYCVNLKTLDISRHKIEDISQFSTMHELSSLNIADNEIKDISVLEDLRNNYNCLSKITIDNNPIYSKNDKGVKYEGYFYTNICNNYDRGKTESTYEWDAIDIYVLEEDVISNNTYTQSDTISNDNNTESGRENDIIEDNSSLADGNYSAAIGMKEEDITSIMGEPSRRMSEMFDQIIYDDLGVKFIFGYENDTRIVRTISFENEFNGITMNMTYSQVVDIMGTPTSEEVIMWDGSSYMMTYDMGGTSFLCYLTSKDGVVYKLEITS